MSDVAEVKKMSSLDCIMLVEDGNFDHTDEAQIAAMQEMIDTGLVWKLQVSWGRFAQRLIDAGIVNSPSPKRA